MAYALSCGACLALSHPAGFSLRMPFSPTLGTSPRRAAERALRKPSSTVWLRGVRVRTQHFDEALRFYGSLLGLAVGGVHVHPVSARMSACMNDADGNTVLEVVETREATQAGTNELSFVMPRRTWQLLRVRLDTQLWPYETVGDMLVVRDVDGHVLRIESMGTVASHGHA